MLLYMKRKRLNVFSMGITIPKAKPKNGTAPLTKERYHPFDGLYRYQSYI